MLSIEELKENLQLSQDYREIRIPKKTGGFRTITIPSPKLKRIQRKILRFLKELYILRDSSVFGLRNGSYASHARFHAKSRWIFTIDLKDAFTSVTKERVRFFLTKNLSERITSVDRWSSLYKTQELIDLIAELTTFNETLPQGAPTSPFLFFMAIEESKLTTKLFYAAQPMKISCYVDGFAISGAHPPRARTKEAIFKCIEKTGFEANFKKTRQYDCHQGSPMIVGLRINGLENRISLPKKTIRKWRGIIYRAATTIDPCEKKDLFLKIQGFISSLKPIYPEKLPPQIAKPYSLLLQSLKGIPIEKKKVSMPKPLVKEDRIFQEKNQSKQKQTCLTDWF